MGKRGGSKGSCRICARPDAREIAALLASAVSTSKIARERGFPESSLRVHRDRCLRKAAEALNRFADPQRVTVGPADVALHRDLEPSKAREAAPAPDAAADLAPSVAVFLSDLESGATEDPLEQVRRVKRSVAKQLEDLDAAALAAKAADAYRTDSVQSYTLLSAELRQLIKAEAALAAGRVPDPMDGSLFDHPDFPRFWGEILDVLGPEPFAPARYALAARFAEPAARERS